MIIISTSNVDHTFMHKLCLICRITPMSKAFYIRDFISKLIIIIINVFIIK